MSDECINKEQSFNISHIGLGAREIDSRDNDADEVGGGHWYHVRREQRSGGKSNGRENVPVSTKVR